jgi:GNAT superfamily N-acetyltransferase
MQKLAVVGNNMITTDFLSIQEYPQFGDWLKSQDEETLQLYFGVAGNESVIQALMDRVVGNPDEHYFLIARDGDRWVGSIHMAVYNRVVEFGVIVDKDYRGHGVANQLMDEALVWARNRGYRELYMHCLGWNKPIQHLCHKHGLETKNMYGDSEVEVELPPADWITINKEICIKQRNLYHMFLQKNFPWFQEIYG